MRHHLLFVGFYIAIAAALNGSGAVAAEMPYAAPAQSLASFAAPKGGAAPLTVTSGQHSIHVFPTVQLHAARTAAASDTGPLLYHAGGAIMPYSNFFAIFWLPASGKLQNGQPTTLPPTYAYAQALFLLDYPRHGISNLTTEYYQTIGATTTYPNNAGTLAAAVYDASPYPASGCNDTATPGNCLTDAQIQAEILKVMKAYGWTGNINTIFLLYTSSGEGSCFDNSSGYCAYTYYCAYHGAFTSGSQNIIYANLPYGNLNVCQVNGTPSPSGNAVADAVIDVASHEVTEAITDPLLNAWFTAQGNEVGDLCNFNYGPNTWDGGKANQFWNGRYYEIQMEFDNHSSACQRIGP